MDQRLILAAFLGVLATTAFIVGNKKPQQQPSRVNFEQLHKDLNPEQNEPANMENNSGIAAQVKTYTQEQERNLVNISMQKMLESRNQGRNLQDKGGGEGEDEVKIKYQKPEKIKIHIDNDGASIDDAGDSDDEGPQTKIDTTVPNGMFGKTTKIAYLDKDSIYNDDRIDIAINTIVAHQRAAYAILPKSFLVVHFGETDRANKFLKKICGADKTELAAEGGSGDFECFLHCPKKSDDNEDEGNASIIFVLNAELYLRKLEAREFNDKIAVITAIFKTFNEINNGNASNVMILQNQKLADKFAAPQKQKFEYFINIKEKEFELTQNKEVELGEMCKGSFSQWQRSIVNDNDNAFGLSQRAFAAESSQSLYDFCLRLGSMFGICPDWIGQKLSLSADVDLARWLAKEPRIATPIGLLADPPESRAGLFCVGSKAGAKDEKQEDSFVTSSAKLDNKGRVEFSIDNKQRLVHNQWGAGICGNGDCGFLIVYEFTQLSQRMRYVYLPYSQADKTKQTKKCKCNNFDWLYTEDDNVFECEFYLS